MKKRLLSAALALAMVLTMLPLTAFADDTTPKTEPVTWYAPNTTFTDTSSSASTKDSGKDGGWFTRTKDADANTYSYVAKTSGVINGTDKSSGGATWVASIDDAINKLNWTSVQLIGDNSTEISTDKTSLTIDLGGHANSAAITMSKGGTLSIKDSKYKSGTVKQGAGAITMGADSMTSSATSSVSLTNVSATSITMEKVGTHNVTLKNAKTTGEIKMAGIGEYTNTSGSKVSVNQKQTFSATDSEIGALTVSGNNSTITLTNTKAGSSAVSLTGTSTTMTVNGSNSTTGDITLVASETELKSGTAPKVTVNGGKVGAIKTGTEKLENASYTVNVNSGSNAETGDITLPNGTISVTGGTTGAIKLGTGSLSVTANGSVGDVTWGGTTAGSLNLTVSGENTNVGAVKPVDNNAVTLNTVAISGGNFTGDFKLGTYAKNGVTGGSFSSSLLGETGWLSSSIEYEVSVSDKTYYYMGSNFQALVNKCASLTTKNTTPTVKRINAGKTTSKISFVLDSGTSDGGDPTKLITIVGNTGEAMLAPASVNNVGVSTWYDKDNSTTYAAGTAIPFPTTSDEERTVYATMPGSDNSDIVSISADNGISATLSGTVIKLSGAAPADSASSFPIKLTITTVNSKYEDVATVTWWSNLKTFGLSVSDKSPFGVVGNTLAYNGKTYSIDISGLKLMASSNIIIESAGGNNSQMGDDDLVNEKTIQGVKVTFNAGETASRPALAAAVSQDDAVDFSDSPAVQEALNRVAGNLSTSTVDSYITAAKRAKAKKAGYSNPTPAQLAANGGAYDKVVIEPFLNVTVSAYNPGGSGNVGTMTANITPYYYIFVIGGNDDDPYIANGNGTALGTLSGDYGEVEVTLGLPANFASSNTQDMWVHHGSYVYEGSVTDSKVTFKTLHGFSPFVLNSVAPVAAVDKVQGGDTDRYYDSLQAAVDEVDDDGVISLLNNYNGEKSLNVTGKARSFTVDCGANGNLALTFNGADVRTETPTNNKYQITLNASTTVGGTASITVKTGTNGSAKASAASAKPGDTVTITTTANSGYKAAAPTVVASTGNVTVTGSGNTWTFTVPANATSVTVTPNFVADDGRIFSDVDPKAWYADAVHNCYNTKPRGVSLMQGNTNGTFTPLNQLTRAEMVQILYNLAGQPSVSGTCPFPDVVGTGYHWAAPAITWAASKGYVIGYTDGKFHPEVNVSRQDMVLILYRYSGANSSLATGNLNNYYDGTGVGWWANEAMRWATAMGILSGTDSVALNGYLRAPQKAARCEAAVTLWNYYQRYGA